MLLFVDKVHHLGSLPCQAAVILNLELNETTREENIPGRKIALHDGKAVAADHDSVCSSPLAGSPYCGKGASPLPSP